MVALDVYRTYYPNPRNTDDDTIAGAMKRAKGAAPSLGREIEEIAGLVKRGDIFSKRFQQFTAPLMAKGFEDTFLYRYDRLIAFNEVGGRPADPGVSMEDLHRSNMERLRRWPGTMNATSTHDSKLGEDARARLAVLSDIAPLWRTTVLRWHGMNQGARTRYGGGYSPDPVEEYRLYQVLVGAMPYPPYDREDLKGRISEYLVKALREAKRHTSWIEPDTRYEEASVRFLHRIMDDPGFMDDLEGFVRRVEPFGIINSLSQTLLKLASPGVPDIYNGCESWNLSLVDPDNRRKVDFDMRKKVLDRVMDPATECKKLLEDPSDGAVKTYLIWKVLNCRKSDPELFLKGDYIPLDVEGVRNIFAFARRKGSRWVVAAVPLHLVSATGIEDGPPEDFWDGSAVMLQGGSPTDWTDVLTGKAISCKDRITLEERFRDLPVMFLKGGG
jgi:(1->4)-alpha-D-glucan 1-alpha-D-glucosylmutase